MDKKERKMEKSPEYYHDLFDSSPAGYFLADSQGQILEANLTLADMLGITREELTGSSFNSLLDQASQEIYKAHTEKVFSTCSRQVCELDIQVKGQSTRHILINSAPTDSPQGDVKVCRTAVIDITERYSHQGHRFTADEFSAILNAIPIPVLITTFPEHIIIDANKVFLDLNDLRREDIQGQNHKILRWMDFSESEEIDRELFQTGRVIAKEVHVYDKFGNPRTALFSAEKIRVANQDYQVAASIDITDRVHFEEALQQSEAFSASLLTSAPYPVLVSKPDSTITYANPALEKLTGYSSRELIGKKIPYPWWTTEYPESYNMDAMAGFTPESYLQERRFIKKNGETFWAAVSLRHIKEHGEIKFILANWVDITELKKAEEQIKHNELELSSILESLTEGVSLISPNGILLRANKAEAKNQGASSVDEILGQHFNSNRIQPIYPDGKTIPVEELSVSAAIKRKRSIRNFEVGIPRDDGSVLWLNVNTVPIIDQAGKVIGVVRSSMDITEQKRLRDEREQFTKRLLQVQEDERKRVSRELHDDTAQYLALLKLEMDDLLEKEKNLPLQTVSRLHSLQATAEKALNEVRRFSHELRPSVLEHFGLTSALELIIEEFKNTCQTEISFDLSGNERRLSDEAELALFRIAQEAISNIRKHAGATQATVSLKFKPQKIRLSIADNGKGFTPETRSQSVARGSLGLVGMRERANLIGAALKIRSGANKGTIVSVELPIN